MPGTGLEPADRSHPSCPQARPGRAQKRWMLIVERNRPIPMRCNLSGVLGLSCCPRVAPANLGVEVIDVIAKVYDTAVGRCRGAERSTRRADSESQPFAKM